VIVSSLFLLLAAQDLALVGGDVYTVSGAMLPRATVVIRGERILAVGKDIPVPASAKKIDCTGKVITPGLIEAESAIGLREIDQEASTVDSSPNWPDPVRAAFNALDAIDLRSPLVAVARRHGVTSAIAAPNGGLISGRSAFIDLVNPKSKYFDRAVRGPVAMHASFGYRGAAFVGGSRATAMMRLREVFDDARIFKRSRAAFEKNALYRMSTSRLDLVALDAVLSGELRFVVQASRASDIVAVLELAKRERLKIAIIGAEEGWLVTKELAAAKVPVIVEPLSNLPDSFEAKNARLDNATLMARAGVKVAISTRSTHLASNLRFMLGNAVRAGLPQELALRAATLVPAEIYGLDKQYGSLEAGKIANVVIWTGDPFEPSSFAETSIIRGEAQPVESRQSKLAERYIQRHGLVR
jgi:imidazolonepropionase-like amidohydrolase